MLQRRTSLFLAFAVALLLISALAACGAGDEPTATPVPPTPTPAPSATPAPSLPAGWTSHETDLFSLALPSSWEALDLSDEDITAVFGEMESSNPELAQLVGSAENLQGAALWAFNMDSRTAGFTDNVNVRSFDLGGETVDDLGPMLDPLAEQYAQMGFDVQERVDDLQVGGRPAARITYDYTVNTADLGAVKALGRQYIVVGNSNVWILSYTVGDAAGDEGMAIIDQSAQTFQVTD